MLLDDSIARVVCEWHEDYVVISESGESALVSVKHLEASQPRWTIRQLCNAGGLAHLFTRWRSTGETSRCLLRTNAGLRSGLEEAEGLRDCCASQTEERLAWWTTRIMSELQLVVDPDPTEDQIRRFLANLNIEGDLPNRVLITSSNLVDLMPSVLAEFNFKPTSASPVYEAIVNEIALASRSFGMGTFMQLIAITHGHQGQDLADLTLHARTINKERLLHAIAGPTTRRSQTRLLAESPDPAMFAEKLARGGFGPTAINNARNLRLNWEHHRLNWSTGFPQYDEIFQITQSEVLNAASRAENATRDSEAPYGVAMHEALEVEIETAEFELPGSDPVDPKLILGCAYDLTATCRIWWSAEFELPTGAGSDEL
jgi:hypothetical protein